MAQDLHGRGSNSARWHDNCKARDMHVHANSMPPPTPATFTSGAVRTLATKATATELR